MGEEKEVVKVEEVKEMVVTILGLALHSLPLPLSLHSLVACWRRPCALQRPALPPLPCADLHRQNAYTVTQVGGRPRCCCCCWRQDCKEGEKACSSVLVLSKLRISCICLRWCSQSLDPRILCLRSFVDGLADA